jgi:biopolymer transport protein ExbD
MGASTQSRGKRGGIVGINVTPMVDVVLVLLVIMMVSATYIVSQSLKVELPKSASSDQAVNTVAAVTITQDGKLYFNQEPTDEEGLAAHFKSALAAGKEVDLVISADASALHGKVVRVIDLAKLQGITKFAIQIERAQAAGE